MKPNDAATPQPVKTSELRIGGLVSLSPGEFMRYLRELRRGPRMDGWSAAKGHATADDNAIAEALLEAFADPYRREGAVAALRAWAEAEEELPGDPPAEIAQAFRDVPAAVMHLRASIRTCKRRVLALADRIERGEVKPWAKK